MKNEKKNEKKGEKRSEMMIKIREKHGTHSFLHYVGTKEIF